MNIDSVKQDNKIIRIGTRGSELALVQTDLVIKAITQQFPEVICEKVIIKTEGDKILDKPLIDFGGKGVFVTEFEEAIINKEIDLAIHSSKDMPVELGAELAIVGVLGREDARDVLVTNKGYDIANAEELIIGTSSLRRQFQVMELYDNVRCTNIRGNVPTRLNKLVKGEYDGIILAAAGLKRLLRHNDNEFDYRYFEYEEMIPAGGQGIIAIEGRIDDEISDMIEQISDKKAYAELEIEREVLTLLEAGCHEAVGVISKCNKDKVTVNIIREINGQLIKIEGTDSLDNRQNLIEVLINKVKEGDING